MLPNTPEMVEAHYAVPGRRGAQHAEHAAGRAAAGLQMNHCEAKVLITDREFAPIGPRCASSSWPAW